MKSTKILVGIFLAVNLLAVCAALLLSAGIGDGRTASAPGRNDAVSGAAPDGSVPVLNPALLSLPGSDNGTLRQTCSGRCYAEVTQHGNFRLTYFSPYLSVQFAPEDDPSTGWRNEGDSDGYYDDNPLADGLLVRRIDISEQIDPKGPALLGEQSGLRQLIQTDEPITYDLFCAVLGQTPELDHKNHVYYDAGYIFDDPEARSSDEQRIHQADQKVTGGHDVAVFKVDGVEITVYFIRPEEEYLAYYAIMEKKDR